MLAVGMVVESSAESRKQLVIEVCAHLGRNLSTWEAVHVEEKLVESS